MTKKTLTAYRLDWLSRHWAGWVEDEGCTLHLSPDEAVECLTAHSGIDPIHIRDFPVGYAVGEVTLIPVVVAWNSNLGKELRNREEAIKLKKDKGYSPYIYTVYDSNPARTVVMKDRVDIAQLTRGGDPVKITLDADRQFASYAPDMGLETVEANRQRSVICAESARKRHHRVSQPALNQAQQMNLV